MKKHFAGFFSFLFLLSFPFTQARACTTFCLVGKGEVLFGGNYDFDIGDGLIFTNKRGVAKTAQLGDSSKPAKWVSKYGSVTFNQFGRENPHGGMNEMGLVVQLMWLVETEYPKDDARPTLGTQEWIQYLLDTSATTAEAIRNAESVRIVSEVGVKLHYLVSDKMGSTASIEFLNGKLVVHSGTQLKVSTLTNNTYDESLNYAKTTPIEKVKTDGSFDRFTRAAERTRQFERQPKTQQEAIDYAFNILSDVEQKGYTSRIGKTQWSIVYDQKRGKIYFRTLQNPQIRSIDTRAFEYACGTPVKMFDVNTKESGDVTMKFTNYTRKANRDLIERSFNGTDFLKDVPPAARFYFASYPESFTCTAAK